jgi:hypothetical protein
MAWGGWKVWAAAVRRCEMRAAFAVMLVVLGATCGASVRQAAAFEQKPVLGVSPSNGQALPGFEIAPQVTERGAGVEMTVPNSLNVGAGNGKLLTPTSPGWSLLPKLDFGLELLYGAPNQGTPNSDQLDTLPDALTVHGELKKQF